VRELPLSLWEEVRDLVGSGDAMSYRADKCQERKKARELIDSLRSLHEEIRPVADGPLAYRLDAVLGDQCQMTPDLLDVDHIGGLPDLRNGEGSIHPWPVCSHCHDKQAFLGQFTIGHYAQALHETTWREYPGVERIVSAFGYISDKNDPYTPLWRSSKWQALVFFCANGCALYNPFTAVTVLGNYRSDSPTDKQLGAAEGLKAISGIAPNISQMDSRADVACRTVDKYVAGWDVTLREGFDNYATWERYRHTSVSFFGEGRSRQEPCAFWDCYGLWPDWEPVHPVRMTPFVSWDCDAVTTDRKDDFSYQVYARLRNDQIYSSVLAAIDGSCT